MNYLRMNQDFATTVVIDVNDMIVILNILQDSVGFEDLHRVAEDKNSWEPLASAELSALKGEMYLGKDRDFLMGIGLETIGM